jgi:serine/threonine-protein kinase
VVAPPPPRSSPGAGEGTAIGLVPSPGAIEAHAVTFPRVYSAPTDKPLTRRCTSCETLYPADFLVCPRDATPLVAVEGEGVQDPLVGALVGETYQIVRMIGEGGMGRVYEARHLRLKERRFAIKCLHADLARNAEMAARFLREAEAASSIKHENVVDVFDVHHLPDGTPYFVGEYLEGEALADYVSKRGPLDPRVAAKVTRQVCSALAAAHARGIVHRDMKPENILVLASSIAAVERGESRTLRVKVLDFGISKVGHGDGVHLTRTGVIMGTPSYMAPEQARGRPVDHRADVYSVGACLYFMVTGRRPFDSEDPTSTLSMVLTEDPIRPRQIDPRIPEMLELVIQRAMAKDVNDRYATIADLEKALAMFIGKSSELALASGVAMAPVQAPVVPDPKASSASRAFDVAKALLGSESMAPPALQQSGHLARTARPTIVIASVALGAWLVGGTVTALAGLVRVLHEGEVTLTESLLLVAGCLFAAATPIALYVVHLRKVVWPNSVRAVQLATDLKRLAVAALVSYGGLSVLGRLAHTVLLRSSQGLASGVWDIALFVVSVVGALSIGGVGPLLRTLRRRRSFKE